MAEDKLRFNLIVFTVLSVACGGEKKVEYREVPTAPPPLPPKKDPRPELPPQNRGGLTPGPGKKPRKPNPKPEPKPPKPKPDPKPEPKPTPPPQPKPEPKPAPKMPELGEHKHNYYWQKDWGRWYRWPWCSKLPKQFYNVHNRYWAHVPNQADWCKRHKVVPVDGGCMCRVP
jgi:hypothetical protein